MMLTGCIRSGHPGRGQTAHLRARCGHLALPDYSQRDLGLALGAFALGRLAKEFD